MSIKSSLIALYNKQRLSRIESFRKFPEETQKHIFNELIKKTKQTIWGKLYGYKHVNSIADFQNNTPISTYDEFKPFIDKTMKGESNVLWTGKTKWFAKSSGTTTDKSKFIPITKESLYNCHYQGSKDVIAIYANNNPNTKLLGGKTITLGGSTTINNLSSNSYCGDLSAIMLKNAPLWSKFFRTPNAKTALINNFDIKVKKIVEKVKNDKNVVCFAGVPSWNLVLMREIIKSTDKDNLLKIFPKMELFMHGGTSFVQYRSIFEELIPSSNMHYMEIYNASEGFFAIQDNPHTDDMLLMLDYGIFYEFIPLSELAAAKHKALTISEVQTNIQYALVISTNGGLWRYLIGDVITFTSLYPHKIKITGRTQQYINSVGEELMVHNATEAINKACEKTQATVSEYTVAPIFMGNKTQAAHQWLIAFEQQPQSIENFIQELDAALKSTNSDYEAKRYKDSVLKQPEVIIASKNLFFNWMRQRGKLGGQNKIPRLSNTRQYMDELLELNNKQQNEQNN